MHDLELFARLAALALHNAGMYEELKSSLSKKTDAETALKTVNEGLEFRVMERTAELTRTNEALKQEIADRKKAQASLAKRERQLETQSENLSEMNAALKVLLRQRENDQKDLEESVLLNVSTLVLPSIERIKMGNVTAAHRSVIDHLEKNLQRIVSPFIRRISARPLNLTPTEIKVAELTREGCTTKEIADRLLLSENTIVFHRYNIRTKLGIKGRKVNLRSHLLSFEE
jgi:DNA-binding CsgD family transcriptional regulator